MGSCEAVAADARGTETVLLVEDEVSARKLMRSTLEGAGYVVIDTENGEQAYDIAISTLPEFPLFDMTALL